MAAEPKASIASEVIRLLQRPPGTDASGVRTLLDELERQPHVARRDASAANLIRRDRDGP